jgi:hypothetical protein
MEEIFRKEQEEKAEAAAQAAAASGNDGDDDNDGSEDEDGGSSSYYSAASSAYEDFSNYEANDYSATNDDYEKWYAENGGSNANSLPSIPISHKPCKAYDGCAFDIWCPMTPEHELDCDEQAL